MAIFATLAVAGWQVFDSVNRARERAQQHADNLAVLQYAYLQLQQDMGQIVAYQAPTAQNTDNTTNPSNTNGNSNSANGAESPVIIAEPFMRLDSEQMSFVRFADPDPRYQSSASLQRIDYIFTDQRLIRRQYTSLQGGSDSVSVSLDSVLLEGVTAPRWQALLPELASRFPDESSRNTVNNSAASNSNVSNSNASNGATVASANEISLVPKGVAVSFTYQEMPISWQWSLAPQPMPASSHANTASSDNSSNSQNSSNQNNNQNSLSNSGSSN